ncbi:MAG: efflux RND transporter periplasmic adaptor subunit [Candidatus Krumholzibacteriia bacterium]
MTSRNLFDPGARGPRRRRAIAWPLALLTVLAVTAAAVWVLAAAPDPAAERCAHGAPPAVCFLCDPALRQPGRLWCGEHGRYEDRCWLCHPDLRDPARPYCDEHGLYEDECVLCGAPATAAAVPKDDGHGPDDGHGHGGDGLWCGEHRLPEASCGTCHPELAAGLAVGDQLLVRLPSPRSAELAGLLTGRPAAGAGLASVRAHAEVAYDRRRLARIPARVEGIVERVLVGVGDHVTAGQILLELGSAEVAAAKQVYLAALQDDEFARRDLARERSLREQAIAAEREVQAAEAAAARAAAAVATAAQQLRNLGLDEQAVAAVAAGGDTSSRLPVRAPFAGVVIALDAVRGEAAARLETLLSVADLSVLWLELHVPQEALPHLALGQPVSARFDAVPGHEVTGTVTWIGSELDRSTRLLAARAEVPDPQGLLKAGLYGSAEIALAGTAGGGLTVPVGAVQDLDALSFVFVRSESDVFALRRVTLGPRLGDRVAVLAGLDPADEVVVTGVQTVATELLKSRLGAGCAGD